jgi:HSP20 family molecular chaperone IbpA
MIRLDMYKGMDSFSREMEQMFRDIGFGRLLEPALAPTKGACNYPRINLRETEDSYIIESQLPDNLDLNQTTAELKDGVLIPVLTHNP